MNKKNENTNRMAFDEEYARYLMKQFPKSVTIGVIRQWKNKDYIPEKYYTLDEVKIHGIEFNILLLMTGETYKKISEILGMFLPQLLNQIKYDRLSEKNMKILENHFIDFKDKKNLTVRLSVVERKHYFLKFSEPEHIYIKELLIFKTKNFGKAFHVEIFEKTGIIKDKALYEGETYESLKSNPLFEEVSRKQATSRIKLINKMLAKYITRL